uniref:SUMO-specific isopeptidase USPL1 isoform X2 n=1 Tax=Pogona vitticeps TaxID=103695 RepID=A0A6J0TB09_9SAUR
MMDCQKSEHGLQHTDIGASAFHMVGYLGKDHNSVQVISDGCCLACKKKGLIQRLRTYRISFEESIFLCENPECIYPLGSEPLSNIVIPIDAKGYLCEETCRKRKLFDTRLVTSVIEPASKLTRTNNAEQTFRPDLPPKCKNNSSETQSGQPDFSQASQPSLCGAAESTEQQMGIEAVTEKNLPVLSRVQIQHFSNYESGTSVSQILPQDKLSVPETLWLQWRNVHALCWLDCVLSAIVHLETPRTVCIGSVSENISVIQKLFAKYNQVTVLVNNCQRGKNILEIPSDVLSRAESYLNEIRNIIFVQLQAQLKCKLGEEESPVFAFPLLLQKDAHIEELFLHSFSWKLECSQCGHQVTDRCQKTLTTFTNIIPEWHPLNAVHIAPCNNCNHTSQRRKMVLENVSSVLMMHFVEGLPHNDLAAYSFRFRGYSYQIKAVVQYQESEKHFITWVLNSETWLECDDLKGSYCKRHKSFGVSPAEIHIVIWERRPPQVTNNKDLQLQNERAVNVPSPKTPPKSPVKYFNDKSVENTSLNCHSDTSNVHPNGAETLVNNNRSNLLWGLENLASDDIVNPNLVSVPLDSEGKPLEDSHIVQSNMTAKIGTLQLQGLAQISVLPCSPEGDIPGNECTLLEHSNAPLYQGQPAHTNSTSVMPTVPVSSSSYSPATLSVHKAQLEVNRLQSKDSSLDLVNAQKKPSKAKSGNTMQKIPNIVQHVKETPSDSRASDPGSSSPFGRKKGAKLSTASWLKGLLGKHPPFLPKSVSACNEVESSEKTIQKEDISTPLPRHASQFSSFQAKWSRTITKKVTTLDSSRKTPTTSPFANFLIENHAIDGNEGTVTNRADSLVSSSKQIQPSKIESKNSTSFDHGETAVDKAHQLRLKLLQDLKAKKEKLASLDKLAKAQVKKRSSSKRTKKNQSRTETQKESESLQSLLNALDHQIDVEYSKSVNSPLTNMSQCSNSTYDDILSELLSPAPTVASLELPQEEECRYLEMGDGTPTSPVLNEKPDVAHDHNYTSPVKENGCEGHSDLLTVKSTLKKLDFESSAKQDILDDLLPHSVLNSVRADTDDMHHFDESWLTW